MVRGRAQEGAGELNERYRELVAHMLLQTYREGVR